MVALISSGGNERVSDLDVKPKGVAEVLTQDVREREEKWMRRKGFLPEHLGEYFLR